jgi:hypothetical protein
LDLRSPGGGVAFAPLLSALSEFYLLQWLSTLAGIACLVMAYRCWLRRMPRCARLRTTASQERWRLRLLLAIVAIALVIAVPLAVEVATQFQGAFAIAVLMRCIAVFGTVAFALLAIACSSYCYWCCKRGILR